LTYTVGLTVRLYRSDEIRDKELANFHTYDTIEEFNVDSKAECDQLYLAGVRRPYNLYCVGADVKPCSINQSTVIWATRNWTWTRTRRLGDKSKSLNLGQSHRPGSCTRSLAVIIVALYLCYVASF